MQNTCKADIIYNAGKGILSSILSALFATILNFGSEKVNYSGLSTFFISSTNICIVDAGYISDGFLFVFLTHFIKIKS